MGRLSVYDTIPGHPVPVPAGYPDPAPATRAGHPRTEFTMDRGEILERLKALIHERFGVDPSGLDGSTTQAEIGID
jgi:hypothetical protein